MSIVQPDSTILAKMSRIIDDVNAEYSKELEMNNDIDDIDSLTEMLNKRIKKARLPIRFYHYDDIRSNPDEWVSAMADFGPEGRYLTIILWGYCLDGKWGPKTFKEVLMKMLGHETIHFNQYVRIGVDKLAGLESGHQKGAKLREKTGNKRDWMRCYLRDPHELMAYGHDLAEEIKLSSNPGEALRSPGKFIDELPVYWQFRQIFPVNARPLRDMLSYAARYYEAI